jgi:imidazole glycerol-phosphate synthase subunit HisH
MRVSIIEYGIGNIQSVANAVERTGAKVSIVKEGEELLSSDPARIILPGVGAVGAALDYLRERNFGKALEEAVIANKVPFLGICVGMQMLGEICEEYGVHQGLGWIPGRVRRLDKSSPGIRLPHVGWNTIDAVGAPDPLLSDVVGKDAYFVHSYVFECPKENVISTTNYGGIDFVSAVRQGHITGVQFHPEKSSVIGTGLLTAFLEYSNV